MHVGDELDDEASVVLKENAGSLIATELQSFLKKAITLSSLTLRGANLQYISADHLQVMALNLPASVKTYSLVVSQTALADPAEEFQRPLAWVAEVREIQNFETEEEGSNFYGLVLSKRSMESFKFSKPTYVFSRENPQQIIFIQPGKENREITVKEPNKKFIDGLVHNGFTDTLQFLSKAEVGKVMKMTCTGADVRLASPVTRQIAQCVRVGAYDTVQRIPEFSEEPETAYLQKNQLAVFIEAGALLPQEVFERLPASAKARLKKIRVSANSEAAAAQEVYLVKEALLHGKHSMGLALPLIWLKKSFPAVSQQQAAQNFRSLTQALKIKKLTDALSSQTGQAIGPMPLGIPRTGGETRLQTLISTSGLLGSAPLSLTNKNLQLLNSLFCSRHPLEAYEKADGQSATFLNKGLGQGIQMFTHTQQVVGGVYQKVCDAYGLAARLPVGCVLQGECIGPDMNGNLYKLAEHQLVVFRAYRVANFLVFENFESRDVDMLKGLIAQESVAEYSIPQNLKAQIASLSYPASQEALFTPDQFYLIQQFLIKLGHEALAEKLSERIVDSMQNIEPNWKRPDACSSAELDLLLAYCNSKLLDRECRPLERVPLIALPAFTCEKPEEIPAVAEKIYAAVNSGASQFGAEIREGVVLCSDAFSCKCISSAYDIKKEMQAQQKQGAQRVRKGARTSAAVGSAAADCADTHYGRGSSALYAMPASNGDGTAPPSDQLPAPTQ